MSELGEFLNAYRYKRDTVLRPWRDLRKDVQPVGNCQDFAWTVLIIEKGGRLKALWALLTFNAIIWRAFSPSNTYLPRHAVLQIGSQYIDSSLRHWRSSPVMLVLCWPIQLIWFVVVSALAAIYFWSQV